MTSAMKLVALLPLLALYFQIPGSAGNCRVRKWLIESGRKCRKPCTTNADCSARNKRCLCDGPCGYSCFNPGAQCTEADLFIANGRFSYTMLNVTGTVTYRCNIGFIMEGESKRSCGADKQWHPKVAPNCTRGCGYPRSVGNAKPIIAPKRFYPVGETVAYECKSGYYLEDVDDNSQTCTNTGWGGLPYSCQEQHCKALENDPHGVIKYSRGFRFGTRAFLTCNKGYRPSSYPTTITCTSNPSGPAAKWLGSLPECEIKRCVPPTEPDDGRIINLDSVKSVYGEQINYECNVGFKLEGNNTGTCEDEGTWGQQPECALDPDCDFEYNRHPLCGYTTPDSAWRRWSVYDGQSAYVAKTERSNAKLTSALIPTTWSGTSHICLTFKYKLLNDETSLQITSTEEHENANIFWESYKNEKRRIWLDSLMNIKTTQSIQYQFLSTRAGEIHLDDIKVFKKKCHDHCESDPCRNNGNCTARSETFTCFCPIDFEGETCNIDIKCPTFTSRLTNGFCDVFPHREGKLIPGSSVKCTCNKNFKLRHREGIETFYTEECNKGYGTRQSYWFPHVGDSFCEEIRCHYPTTRSHQHLIVEHRYKASWGVGQHATAECDIGYGFTSTTPLNDITCNDQEQWNGRFTSCQDTRCNRPPYPQNGVYSTQQWKWNDGDTIVYRCNENYKFNTSGLVKTLSAQCRRRWFWQTSYWNLDKQKFQCVKIYCVPPDAYPHQRLVAYSSEYSKYTAPYYVGDVATYECDPGYELPSMLTTESFTCMNNEMWTGRPSPCTENIRCQDPNKIITDGKLEKDPIAPLLPDSTVTYKCNDGYKLSGETTTVLTKTVVCVKREHQLGSEWIPSISSIICIRKYCDRPTLHPNQILIPAREVKWYIGDIVYIECNAGYEFPFEEKTESIRCRNDETWSSTPTECQENIKCEHPDESIIGGKLANITSAPLLPNSTAVYECNRGYKIAEQDATIITKTVKCVKKIDELGSEWIPKPSSITCIRIVCVPPEAHSHQYLVKYDEQSYPLYTAPYYVGDKASYKCHDGYEFPSSVKTERFTCRNDETWSGTPTPCNENVKCQAPDKNITNGKLEKVSDTPLLPDSTATYKCNDGYKLSGENTIVLTVTAKCVKREYQLGSAWVPEISSINCVKKYCTSPTLHENQNFTNPREGKWFIGDIANITCNTGYEFPSEDETESITCRNDETWSSTPTQCQENIKCESPNENIINGNLVEVEPEPLLPNSTAVYQCNDGYKFAEEDATISTKTVKCVEKQDGIGSEWIPKPSFIKCNPKYCDPIALQQNQHIENDKEDEWYIGDEVHISCNDGYEFLHMEQTESFTCGDNEIWSGTSTLCKKVERVFAQPAEESFSGETSTLDENSTEDEIKNALYQPAVDLSGDESSTYVVPEVQPLPELDLSFLLPAIIIPPRSYQDRIDSFINLTKAVVQNVIATQNLRVSIHQYGQSDDENPAHVVEKIVNFTRIEANQETQIDNFTLSTCNKPTDKLYFRPRTIREIGEFMKIHTRQNASKILVVLVNTGIKNAARIASMFLCMNVSDVNLFLVEVDTGYTRKYNVSPELKKISDRIDPNGKSWNDIKLASLPHIAADIAKEIKLLAIPRHQRGTCEAIRWQKNKRAKAIVCSAVNEELYYAGDRIFLHCSDPKRIAVARCKWNGKWSKEFCKRSIETTNDNTRSRERKEEPAGLTN